MPQFNSIVQATMATGFLGLSVLDQDYNIPFLDDTTIKTRIPMPGENMTLASVQIRHLEGTWSGGTPDAYTIDIRNTDGHGSGDYSMLSSNAVYNMAALHASNWQAVAVSSTVGNQNNGTGILGASCAEIVVVMDGTNATGGPPKGIHVSLKWVLT